MNEELRASQMQLEVPGGSEETTLPVGGVPHEIEFSAAGPEPEGAAMEDDSFPEPNPGSNNESPSRDSLPQPPYVPRRPDGKRTVKVSAKLQQFIKEKERAASKRAKSQVSTTRQVHPNDEIISHLTAQSGQQLSDIEMPPLILGASGDSESPSVIQQCDPEFSIDADEVFPTTDQFGADSNSTNPIIWLPVSAYQHSTHPFTNQQKAYMRIYNLFESIGAPHYAIDELVKILVEEEAHLNVSTLPSRATFVKHVLKRFGGPPLTEHVVHLETPDDKDGKIHHGFRDTVTVYTFDCEHQIRDLFSDDTLFGDPNNLVVNSTNPFHPFKPEPVIF
jgi:hypothetical protein